MILAQVCQALAKFPIRGDGDCLWTGLKCDVEFNMVAVHPFGAPDCSGNHENDCGLRLEASQKAHISYLKLPHNQASLVVNIMPPI